MLATHALLNRRCVSVYGCLNGIMVLNCTYNTPKLKIVSRPILPFLYNFRPHTLAIGSNRITKSENVLIAAEDISAAF